MIHFFYITFSPLFFFSLHDHLSNNVLNFQLQLLFLFDKNI